MKRIKCSLTSEINLKISAVQWSYVFEKKKVVDFLIFIYNLGLSEKKLWRTRLPPLPLKLES